MQLREETDVREGITEERDSYQKALQGNLVHLRLLRVMIRKLPTNNYNSNNIRTLIPVKRVGTWLYSNKSNSLSSFKCFFFSKSIVLWEANSTVWNPFQYL